MRKIQALPLLLSLLLAGCVSLTKKPDAPVASECQPCPVCPAPGTPAVVAPPPAAKPMQLARWEDLPGWGEDDLRAAWPAFLQSCRGVASKAHGPQWRRVCEQAKQVDGKRQADIRRFFEKEFLPYALVAPDGNSSGMMTGYYEPLLKGSRKADKAYAFPVLGVPDDLLTIDLSDLFPDLKDRRLRGRLVGNKVLPYYTRAEINAREGKLPAKPLLWVDDAIELFFLQIQGSGRVRLPDGSMVRLNYADQNGHPYQSIGRVLIEWKELKPEEASMQGIQNWVRNNPTRLNELLNTNPSYVFFRELPNSGEGPIGALGVPLTAERSIAIDPRNIPLGAPVFMASTRPNSPQPMNRLMLAQDTGGAIKGVVRADFFWGFGKEAGEQAGRMKQSGRLWVLLPAEAAPKP